MGKRGPKPNPGKREPNGRLDRGNTMERLTEMSRQEKDHTMSVVLAQPHRRDQPGAVTDRRLGHAVGRFCKLYGIHANVLSACEEYASAEIRWLTGWGKPKGHERHDPGSGEGPSPEQMDGWLAKIRIVERTVKSKYGLDAFLAFRRLVVEDVDLALDTHAVIKSALYEVAIALEWMDANPHPFGG